MKQNRNWIKLVALLALLLTAAYFLFKDDFSEWDYNLNKTKKNAYGTFLFYELLKAKYQPNDFYEIEKSVVESLRALPKNKKYNYVFVNYAPYYDSATIDTLCKFAYSGNTVFISAESIWGTLRDSILNQMYHIDIKSSFDKLYERNRDTIPEDVFASSFNFIHPSLKHKTGYTYYRKYKADTLHTYYNQFVPVVDSLIKQPIADENALHFIGFENSYGIGLNIVELQHGKGKFVIMLSTIPFTNYFMRNKNGLEYIEKLLSYLPNSATIWDNKSHILDYKDTYKPPKGKSSFGETPLYFILQNKALRWAWYLLIIGVIVYALFHAKRRQRIIPIIEPKQNNSLKYVETIGQLYLHENEHIEIATEMRHLFLNFIRQKYYLKTSEIDDAFFNTLAQKSTIEIEKIKSIFDDFKRIQKVQTINQSFLQTLNQKLEYFYSNCK